MFETSKPRAPPFQSLLGRRSCQCIARKSRRRDDNAAVGAAAAAAAPREGGRGCKGRRRRRHFHSGALIRRPPPHHHPSTPPPTTTALLPLCVSPPSCPGSYQPDTCASKCKNKQVCLENISNLDRLRQLFKEYTGERGVDGWVDVWMRVWVGECVFVFVWWWAQHAREREKGGSTLATAARSRLPPTTAKPTTSSLAPQSPSPLCTPCARHPAVRPMWHPAVRPMWHPAVRPMCHPACISATSAPPPPPPHTHTPPTTQPPTPRLDTRRCAPLRPPARPPAVFSFVRNPWARALSSWHHVHKHGMKEPCFESFEKWAQLPSRYGAKCLAE